MATTKQVHTMATTQQGIQQSSMATTTKSQESQNDHSQLIKFYNIDGGNNKTRPNKTRPKPWRQHNKSWHSKS
jgi:hypothetical protein